MMGEAYVAFTTTTEGGKRRGSSPDLDEVRGLSRPYRTLFLSILSPLYRCGPVLASRRAFHLS